MVNIYILKLKDGKYYVGKSNNLFQRIDKHFDMEGSEWTKKYAPVDIMEIHENCDPYDEDKYVIKFMEMYGINNVRGGSFCRIKLTDGEQEIISKMIKGSNDRCFLCGKDDHFINKCPDKNSSNSHFITSFSKIFKGISDILSTLIDYDKHCSICGRDSHKKNRCYAKYHIDGYKL
jgi:hypothetical protein